MGKRERGKKGERYLRAEEGSGREKKREKVCEGGYFRMKKVGAKVEKNARCGK